MTTWSKAVDYPVTAHGYDAQIWYGTVTTTGSSTITVNYPGGAPSDWIEFNAQEFSSSAGSGTTWGVDHTGTQSNASSTTETFPSLSPSGSGELYFGYADAIGGYPSVGSTSGFTYGITSGANVVAYDTNVSSPSAYQPTASVSPAEVSLTLATAFTATGSGGGGGAASISAVGSLASNAATGLSTLAVSPQHVGDMLALTTLTWSGSMYPSSISGGGVTTWSKAVDYPVTADGYDAQIWYGKVTTTGSSTITVNYPGSAPGDWIEFNAQEFSSSAGSGTTWGVDQTGTQSNASSTTETFPSLSPSGSGELYFGYADAIGGYPSVGSTSGFTYGITSGANVVAYDTNVSSPSAYQPTASVSPAEVSLTLAAAFTATGSGGGGGAATISAVGSLASNAAMGLSTLAVSPQHVGDMLALTTLTWSGSVYPTSISGGGVTTWSKAVDYPVTADGYDAQIWYGTVTTTGSSTITVNYPGGAPSDWIEFNAQEVQLERRLGHDLGGRSHRHPVQRLVNDRNLPEPEPIGQRGAVLRLCRRHRGLPLGRLDLGLHLRHHLGGQRGGLQHQRLVAQRLSTDGVGVAGRGLLGPGYGLHGDRFGGMYRRIGLWERADRHERLALHRLDLWRHVGHHCGV